MAEALFAHKVQQAGLADQFLIDSCGTGPWHVGEKAHRGTQKVLKNHGIAYDGRGRQIEGHDLNSTDYLIAMSQSNLDSILRMGQTNAEVKLLLEYANDVTETDVPDPYYSDNFEYVYRLVDAGTDGLLSSIRSQHGF